jgi:hypothetical protein
VKVLANLDLSKNQTLNRVLQQLSSAPGSPTEGQEYYDTTTHKGYLYNGSAWVEMDGTAAVTYAAPGSSAVGDSVAAGSATTVSRSDHVHGREAFVTNTVALGSAAAAGAATTLIRSDATIAAFDATVPSTQAFGDAAAVGAAAFAARRDHKHAMPANPAPAFATPAIVLGTAAAAGAAATVIRSDATIAAFDATVPSTSAVADAAAAGSAAVAARRDHVHGREGFGAVSAQTAFGAASANGSATTEARSDHTHGTPTHLTADHSAVALSGLAVPTADVSLNSHKITNLLDPTAAQDAATKGYVDAGIQGVTWKPEAAVATTGALPNTPTYANGASGVGATLTANTTAALGAIDGYTPGAAVSQVITACTNSGTTVTATVGANAGLTVGQTITVTGCAGFTTNNPNGTWTVASLIGTTQLTFVAALAPTGSYTASTGSVNANADRVLVKNEAAPANDGLYVVTNPGTASAAWVLTRVTDMDVAAEFPGAGVFVRNGTTNGGQGYIVTGAGPFVIGTTAVVWTQISGVADITAGTGLTKSGNTIQIDAAYVGQSTITTLGTITTGTWTGTTVALPNGGTGATTAAAARTNLGATTKFATNVGDGASTSIVVTHNLGTTDVIVQVHAVASTFDVVMPDIQITSTNTITLIFAVAPASAAYRCVVIG